MPTATWKLSFKSHRMCGTSKTIWACMYKCYGLFWQICTTCFIKVQSSLQSHSRDISNPSRFLAVGYSFSVARPVYHPQPVLLTDWVLTRTHILRDVSSYLRNECPPLRRRRTDLGVVWAHPPMKWSCMYWHITSSYRSCHRCA